MKTKKNQIWNFNNEIDAEVCGEGVKRKILAYADEMMCVENQFEFTINGEKKIVNPGDALLKRDSIEHGCVCLKEGILLDIFTPMREEFVQDQD